MYTHVHVRVHTRSDAPINRQNIGNRLIGHIFTTSVIGFY